MVRLLEDSLRKTLKRMMRAPDFGGVVTFFPEFLLGLVGVRSFLCMPQAPPGTFVDSRLGAHREALAPSTGSGG